jgi:hypothetical protein
MKVAMVALGAGFSGSLANKVLAGEVPTRVSSKAVFNDKIKRMVAALAELIIPETDTPGAVEAGVPAFIEMMVSDWYKDSERDIFFQGLATLDQYCQSQFKTDFNDCTQDQQIAALKSVEAAAKTYKNVTPMSMDGKTVDENIPFFTKMKELTVLGYYTSEVGAKQELSYNPVPMRFDGDYDFSKVGRQWSW